MENADLYRENIIEHYKRPRNFEKLEDFSTEAEEHNPLCGDRIKVWIKVEGKKIAKIGWQAQACAICTASASMLSERVKGESLQNAKKADKRLVLSLIGIDPGPARLGCALLPLKAFKLALYKYLAEK
ncbi:MAG: iron-sulfur cluster assembly scaffold protein [Candidatus Micrarchaeota archaeon]|nr:iron-sulfur cluster assembly scaffold protein [Candidatus Micrarchaeota archaeon]